MVDINWGALQPPANAFGEYLQGQQAGEAIRRQNIRQNAFERFSTDPKAAITELMGADPAAALQLRSVMREDEQDQGYKDAAAAYAAGDSDAARAKAVATRNPQLVQTFASLDKDKRELVKEQSGLIASALYPIQKMTDPAQRQAAWEQQKAALRQRQVPDAALDIDVTDDNAIRSHISDAMDIKALIDADYKERTFGETQRHNLASERAAGIKTVAPGGSIVDTNPSAGRGRGAAAVPDPTPAPAVGPEVPRGIRNNNPLNLEATVKWDGMTGSDGRYAKFGTMEQGLAAADRNLQTYATTHGLTTVAGIVGRWAPEGKDGNDPAAYAATVAKDLGVGPNDQLDMQNPGVRRSLLEAMAKVELGQPLPGVPQGGPDDADAAGGPKVIYKAPDRPEGDAPLTPEDIDYLAQQYVRTGQLPTLGMGRAAVEARSKIIHAARQIEAEAGTTGADAAERHAANKARVTALATATKTRAMSESFEKTAIRNADLMLQLAPKGGGPTGIPVANRWIQAGRQNIAGDKDVTAFNIALGTFADEYAKIVSGSMGNQALTDSARQEAYSRLSKYASNGQLQAGVATMKQEMANRLQSMREEESSLRADIKGSAGGPKPSPGNGAAAPPKVGEIRKGYRFLGGDPSKQTSWAKV